MAMRERTRRCMMAVAWGGLLVAASMLVGLRVGRPVYYTDGQRERSATELASSGMLEWSTPESTVELPGPVQGRVAELPDGRLLYGRSLEDGTTDLVVFDPKRPTLPPEPAYGLNSPQNELAPAVTADGRVWFASDRAGGAGGYDLYVATCSRSGFGAPSPVAVCNTALDETDPAPAGDLLVFVRIDPQHEGGNDGVLYRASLQQGLEPQPLFGEAQARRRGQAAVDRDPAFTPDGGALWFVRKEAGQPLRLQRASQMQGVFDAPVAVGLGWGTGELRAPLPSADGLHLRLLQPHRGDDSTDLWFVAEAHEVYPWWPGQRWFEWLLLGTAAVCLPLLVLLHFGRRWATLDLVAQFLLLSLLLHVLVYLWLMGVEILGSPAAGKDDGGSMQVSVVTQTGATSGERSADGQLVADVAAMAQLTPELRELTAAAPGAEVERQAGAELTGPAAERNDEASPHEVAAAVLVHDAAATPEPRAGRDSAATIEPAAAANAVELAATGANAASHVQRDEAAAAGAQGALVVVAPPVALAHGESSLSAGGATSANDASPLPVAKSRAVHIALQDAVAGSAATAATAASPNAAPPSKAPPGATVVPVATALAGPGAASGAAVQPHAAGVASAAAPLSASPVPGTSLERSAPAMQEPVLAPHDAAPARSGAASRRPSAPVALHDGPPAPAPGPVGAGSRAPAATGPAGAAVMPMPLAGLAPTGPQGGVADRPQRHVDSGPRAASALASPAPGSLLERPAAAPVAMPVSSVPVAASAYSNRFGPAKAKALEQFGGTDATERAVANGLRYLAKIQNSDGSWGDRSDMDNKYGLVYVGKTALCVLAFLGAGHTPQSNTEHSDVVRRAVAHLLSLQDDSGAFGASSCYGHGITTYALAECYGITRKAELKQPLERALTWILDNQGPRRDRRNRGGWGYFSPGLHAEDDFARVSVTSWMVMALESARLSGIELPPQVLPAAREFLELAFDQPNGWFRYNHKPSRVGSAWPTLPASTPAGAFCLLLLGAGKENEMVRAAVAYTVERRPEQYRRYEDDEFVLRGQGNVYFWYYGTLASFLAGGDAWQQWNERLRTVLPEAQAKDGSFVPIDVYAQQAGDNRRDRSYTTAMCVLCLEVYYRYFTPLLVGR